MKILVLMILVGMGMGCAAGQVARGACGEIEYGARVQIAGIVISGDLHGKREPGEGVCPSTEDE